jgi:hypothetical protein
MSKVFFIKSTKLVIFSFSLLTLLLISKVALSDEVPAPNYSGYDWGSPERGNEDLKESDVSTWTKYWNDQYGYGLAVPSHWIVYPPPKDGQAATMTLMNYDEDIGRTYTKSDKWPKGSIKIDLVIIKDIDPELSLEEAIYKIIENDSSTIESIEEIFIDFKAAISVISVDKNDTSNKNKMLVFRISQDKLILINVAPKISWKSSDVEAILNSMVFSNQENIIMPTIIPKPPLKIKRTAFTPTVIHPCGYGDEVGDSPIELHMPFSDGTTWTAGGWGYYYGDGTHKDSTNTYYSVDWNKGAYPNHPQPDLNEPVYPVAPGILYEAEYNIYNGNYVRIQHQDGVTTHYLHFSAFGPSIPIGTNLNIPVDLNTVIGYVGSTGNSTGSHLHLSFRVDGVSKYNTPPSRRPSPMQTEEGIWELCDSQSRTAIRPSFSLPSLTDGKVLNHNDNPTSPPPNTTRNDNPVQPGETRQAEHYWGLKGIDWAGTRSGGCNSGHIHIRGAHGGDLAEYLVNFPSANQTYELNVIGLPDDPQPVKVDVYVDGAKIGGITWNDSNPRCNEGEGGNSQKIQLSGYQGVHAVAFRFANDYYSCSGGWNDSCDRDFWFDYFKFKASDPPQIQPPIPPDGCGLIPPGYGLGVNQAVMSCDGDFWFVMQSDGNLVLYLDATPLWASNTDGQPAYGVYMQQDGNLVIYDSLGNPLWHTETYGNEGAYLAIQNDGNAVIYNQQGQWIWQTGTCCY